MTGWSYVLVAKTDDRDRALAAALEHGQDAASLVRTVDGTSVADALRPDGTWHGTDELLEIYWGAIAWAVPITPAEARTVVVAWQRLDRLHGEPDLDEPVPAEYTRRARVHELANRLLASPPPADAVKRVRGTLLDAAGELAPAWTVGHGRVVVPVSTAIGLTYQDEIERVRAFALLGADTLWAVSVADAETIRLFDVPTAVELANEDDWLAAVGRVYIATGDVVLTTPRLDAALVEHSTYRVVAGPPAFVRAVVGP